MSNSAAVSTTQKMQDISERLRSQQDIQKQERESYRTNIERATKQVEDKLQ